MFLLGSKTRMVAPENALPGRPDPIPTSGTHFVLGTPLKPPFPEGLQTAVVGMGCFWGAERVFWQADGVYTTAVGYAGGYTPNPTYEETCSGKTGHTEAVLVVFDPEKITYEEILKLFWEGHDPTQAMRQGNDVGTQYRSAVYTTSPEQLAAVESYARRVRRAAARGRLRRRSRPRWPSSGSSTTPRTTTSSTWRRCRTATAASAAPASPARSGSAPRSDRSARRAPHPCAVRSG